MSWEGPDPERDEDRYYPLAVESCGRVFIKLDELGVAHSIDKETARQLLRDLEAVV